MHYILIVLQSMSSNKNIIKPCERVVEHLQDCELGLDMLKDPNIKLTNAQQWKTYNIIAPPCAQYMGLYLNNCLYNGNKMDEIAIEKQMQLKKT